MANYRIAVLLSAYNGEKYIETQIDSILAQKNAEAITLIVRNDGSQDATLSVLRKIQQANPKVEIIEGTNVGLVTSFFELLKYAVERGFDYYSFCDHDDYWLPDKLSVAVAAIAGKEGPCMYGACSMLADEELRNTGNITQIKRREITIYNSAIQNFCPGHNQVLNKKMAEMVLRHTQLSPKIYSQDMWITKVAALTGEIVFDATPRVLYRQHMNNQLSYGKGKIQWVKDHLRRLIEKSEGRKIAIQLKHFADCYEEYLSSEEKEEIADFFSSQSSFAQRLGYVFHTKMYRQKKYETTMFKMIYLFGGYNVQ